MEKIKRRLFRKKNLKRFNIFCISIIVIIIFIINNFYIVNSQKAKKQRNLLSEIEINQDNDTGTNYSYTFDNEDVLINPGKGYVIRDSLNNEYDDVISVIYYRISWNTIEPQEGKYNWHLIDSKIEDCVKRGKKFAFGIMNANTSSSQVYVTPKWVFDYGAEYYTYYNETRGITQIIPVWTDRIFLEKLNEFIKALAERYDGNPNIEFIDIRSYGNWGEQHLGTIGGNKIDAEQLKELYIKPYMNAFKNTLLVNPWGEETYNSTYEWAIDNGISIRRDGIMKYTNGKYCFEYSYGKVPTIFEFYAGYNSLKKNGYWSKELLMEYIENWKPSYIQFDIDMYEENKDFCNMLANKIGYYFKFKGATYTNTTSTIAETPISLKFINEGVAPLYEPCTVYIGLLDENYNLVKKYKTDINPQTWMPDEEIQEDINIKFDDIKEGKYIISLGLFYDESDENPTYLLGNSGGTDNKWYVFGEILINTPNEEYSIIMSDDDYLINTYNDYNINIDVKNIRKNSNYTAKIFVDEDLKEFININNEESTFNYQIKLNLENGKKILKIQIEKDNKIVKEFSKEIMVSNFINDYKVISEMAIEKYNEFTEKFAGEIAQIPELTSKIEENQKYMESVGQVENKIVGSATIQAMKNHFELGNLILQAYRDGKLQAEDVKISSMLDMLNDIGDSYEDLVTVSAQTVEQSEIEQTNKVIQEAETTINNNQGCEIIYPVKILDFAKDHYEKATYINSLEEDNDIKNGLIISNNLHASLLANWAKTFAQINVDKFVDEYITNNPVTIEYSTTEYTNQNVKATIKTNAEIQITNNSNSKEHTFEQNGSFTFEYTIKGQALEITATVQNIDKVAPSISGVQRAKLYTKPVSPKINDENLKEIKLILNSQVVSNYKNGDTLQDEGFYELTATDKAENTTTTYFQIFINNDTDYKIEENYIKNVTNNTKKSDFDKKINLSVHYKIYRNETELKQDDIIATGDILTTEVGDNYTIIVPGDINKDGQVNLKDFIKMRIYLLLENNLDDIEMLAADCNNDNQPIGVKDYIRMRLIILMNEH